MKQIKLCACILIMAFHANAQSIDPVSLIIAKVIKAIDLKIQKMQNETIWLQQAQQLAEHELSKAKLAEIAGWQNAQAELYDGYFKELASVKSVIKELPQVKQIFRMQAQIVQEYGRLAKDVSQKHAFDQLLLLSKDILGSLQQLLTNNTLTMKDADRLMLLSNLRNGMADCLDSMKELNKQSIRQAAARTRIEADLQFMKKLNGNP